MLVFQLRLSEIWRLTMMLLDQIRADRAANHEPRMKFFLVVFRAAQWARTGRGLRRLSFAPLAVVYKLVSACLMIELPLRASVGVPLVINHGFGLVVHPDAIIGDNCVLKHGVTIGIRRNGEGVPRLGSHVQVGSGAQLLGPISLGDDSIVGAGAVVVDDVPSRGIAVGTKARVVKQT
ncbi:serine O-acetyltransferase [Microbacterium sp. NPDC090007]|uniref:serine O-acetyltransferase n=1 Tax=Microbacterium sp. NPDC090007 TaxID=3364204 RepID=UPI0037FDDA56